ncbi:hypothetical protein QFZ28_000168 [Neobacillus niacini]|uniref:hypothetical protein n=1 Tax=Neobacillus niacini TaxID=86668 RepID=UPI00278828A9|nr:hypothetical protein [Neobacillus niacini]MDQ0999768.1 hypothetical protein [Neobacillus niacini]
MKQFELNVNDRKTFLEDKSHAGIFRQFWAHFMNLDLNKTIKTIESAGIRTSDSEYFVSINGSKKKNIFVKEGFWIYTHLTPEAMLKAYDKFITEWERNREGEHIEIIIEVSLEESDDEKKAQEKPMLKNIYKKSMAIELIKMGNDLHHTMRNRENPKYQVFVLIHTDKLDRDIAILQERLERERSV